MWQEIAPFLGPLVAVAGMVGSVWWRLNTRLQEVRDELADYRLEVAEKYAQVGHLKEVEVRLAGSIDRLADRLTERMDKLLEQLTKPGRGRGV